MNGGASKISKIEFGRLMCLAEEMGGPLKEMPKSHREEVFEVF